MAPPEIPGYELGRVVGRGGRSVVYEAADADTGAAVALKVLDDGVAADPKSVRLFRRELRAGLSAAHPHLVRVLGGDVFRPPYHLVMELLPGESLRQRLVRFGRLEPGAAVATARQTAAGLSALHAAGFVHADVKPENVRLPGPGKAKLVDLGFAHRPGDDAELHAAGTVMGTANYLAPEMCCRPPEDDFPADVFALGVMLFELLTGVLPYRTGSMVEVVRRHRDEPPASLHEHGEFAPAVVRVVDRLLARDPSDRPTARAAALELAAVPIGLLRRAA